MWNVEAESIAHGAGAESIAHGAEGIGQRARSIAHRAKSIGQRIEVGRRESEGGMRKGKRRD
jgi:hypothetical protein